MIDSIRRRFLERQHIEQVGGRVDFGACAGFSLFIATRVPIGHAELMARLDRKREAIGALRKLSSQNEARNDEQDSRLVGLEKSAVLIPQNFQLQLDELRKFEAVKFNDLERRISDTQSLIVGRKGGGFHQEHWKAQAVPILDAINRRIEKLESRPQ